MHSIISIFLLRCNSVPMFAAMIGCSTQLNVCQVSTAGDGYQKIVSLFSNESESIDNEYDKLEAIDALNAIILAQTKYIRICSVHINVD